VYAGEVLSDVGVGTGGGSMQAYLTFDLPKFVADVQSAMHYVDVTTIMVSR